MFVLSFFLFLRQYTIIWQLLVWGHVRYPFIHLWPSNYMQVNKKYINQSKNGFWRVVTFDSFLGLSMIGWKYELWRGPIRDVVRCRCKKYNTYLILIRLSFPIYFLTLLLHSNTVQETMRLHLWWNTNASSSHFCLFFWWAITASFSH